MKIYHLSHAILPSETPGSLQVMKTCEAFVRLGHKVILFGFSSPYSEQDEHSFYAVEKNFKIIQFRKINIRVLGMAIYAQNVTRMISELGPPDIFYAREAYSLLFASRFKCALFYETHMKPANVFKQYIEGMIFRRSNFSGLIAITNSLKAYYSEVHSPITHEKVLVSPNGADPPSQEWDDIPMPVWPGREGCFQVGYVGGLRASHGIAFIITLAARNPDMDFHIVGGHPNKVAYWKRVSRGKNIFFHGFVQQKTLPGYYKKFDLLIAPYFKRLFSMYREVEFTNWTSPLKIFEYMARKKPILISDLPVLHEVLTHGKNAWLVQPENLDNWNSALKLLQQDKILRKTLADNAFHEFINKYTWDQRAQSIIKFIMKKHLS